MYALLPLKEKKCEDVYPVIRTSDHLHITNISIMRETLAVVWEGVKTAQVSNQNVQAITHKIS